MSFVRLTFDLRRTSLSGSENLWAKYGPFAAFAVALTALLGSLYYTEIAGVPMCLLCWYQRILMYPLVLILLVGILKRDADVFDYVLPLSVIGIGVAAYHYLIQLGVLPHPAACSVDAPCNLRDVNYLGFVTIPLMSLAAFAVITLLMALGKWAGRSALDATSVTSEPKE